MLAELKRMLEIILENIVTAPEQLGLPAVYAESDVLLYRQYGRYDMVAVQREGRQLLKRAEALQEEYDITALPRLAKQYAEWSKKLQQLKFKRLLHGEFAAGKGITLYVNAIRQECAEHGWDYAAYYDSVLVHERVHLLHYQAVLAHFGAAGAAVQSTSRRSAIGTAGRRKRRRLPWSRKRWRSLPAGCGVCSRGIWRWRRRFCGRARRRRRAFRIILMQECRVCARCKQGRRRLQCGRTASCGSCR